MIIRHEDQPFDVEEISAMRGARVCDVCTQLDDLEVMHIEATEDFPIAIVAVLCEWCVQRLEVGSLLRTMVQVPREKLDG